MSQVELNSRLGPLGWDRGSEPRAKASSTRATRNGRRRLPFRILAPWSSREWGYLAINTCPNTYFGRLVFYSFEDACDIPEFDTGVRGHVGVLADLV
ncbi:hypothetical protein E6H35_04975 [Candidatus Bathyarchaeota archaeon]|nr:MAG: hypothetical protein E6H35_04975 [Candidatus Bathyarchaeota archaeon]